MKLQRLLAVLLVLACGCSPKAAVGPTGKKNVPASNATSAPEAVLEKAEKAAPLAEEAPASVDAAPVVKKEETPAEDNSPAEGKTSAIVESLASNEAVVEKVAKDTATERLVLLSSGGPLVVEIAMAIDGQPFDAPLKALIEDLLQAADTNHDGRPTWEEVVNSPALKSGQYGNLPVGDEEEAGRMVRLYDVDRDGEFDANEAPRFLTRNAGQSAAFSLQSANEYRNYTQLRSLIGLHLDTDHDGIISREEIETSAKRLRSRDADDDGVLLAADFDDTPDVRMTGAMPNRRRRGPDTAIRLDALTRWGTLQYSLEEMYGVNGVLDEESFPLTPELFRQLDADADGEISEEELQALVTIEPQIRLEARFGEEPQSENQAEANNLAPNNAIPNNAVPRPPQIKLLEIAEPLASQTVAATDYAQRITLALPGVRLEFFVNDGVNNNLAQQAAVLFQRFDADKNGYLEEEELPEVALPGGMLTFADLDNDQDDKVYPAEYAAYLRRRQGPAMSQIRARAADHADTLFSVLDQNSDGRLSEREIDSAPATLAKLDANADQRITGEELPSGLILGLVRGNVQQNNTLFAPPVRRALSAKDAPRWFTSMDLDADGEISPREFLGSPEQFSSLDVDQDGYLEVGEIEGGKK